MYQLNQLWSIFGPELAAQLEMLLSQIPYFLQANFLTY